MYNQIFAVDKLLKNAVIEPLLLIAGEGIYYFKHTETQGNDGYAEPNVIKIADLMNYTPDMEDWCTYKIMN